MNFLTGAEAAKHEAHSIGIRPEHMIVSRESGPWKGTIGVAEHLGSDTFLYVTLEDGSQVHGQGRWRSRAASR